MKRRIMFGRLRTATNVTTAGALLCAVLVFPVSGAAAADASTKYLGIFREVSPTEIAPGTVSRYGVTPASVMWFDSWASGNAFNAAAARSLWSQGIMTHYTWEPWNTALGVSDPNQIHLQDIINGGTSTITGWTVTFTLPAGHVLTGSWNANVTTSGQTVTARGVGHNSTLTPGAVGEWGLQASRPNGNTALPGAAACTSP